MWRERRRLVEVWRSGRATALATLVAVDGSSYRHTGARLMLASDGTHVGTISGGCLESEVLRKMHWLTRDGACVQRYSTALDDTSEIPFGLGCGGTIDLLLEPAGTPEFELLMSSLEGSLAGIRSQICTDLPIEGQPFDRRVQGGDCGVPPVNTSAKFLESVQPPPRLIIAGAGDDAQPLVSLAAMLGWRVLLVDGRAQYATRHRFPEAELVSATAADDVLPFQVNPDDLAVIMTHSYEQDREWLRLLLPHGLRYLGLLGARHRSAHLAADVAEALKWPLERVCAVLRAPVGLDLGGDGAETIALAILAEMQACVAGSLLISRRLNAAEVAAQVGESPRAYAMTQVCSM